MTVEPAVHPAVDAAVDLLKPRFCAFIGDERGQGLLSTPNRMKWMLNQLPADLSEQRQSLMELWSNEASGDSIKRWNTLKRYLKDQGRFNVIKELIINSTYPRLDINVTTGKHN